MIKKILPSWLKKIIKRFLSLVLYCSWVLRCELNNFFLDDLIKKYKKIHLGCGDIRLKNFINVDFRATKATDITKDCSKLDFLPNRSIDILFANAFLEHLYLSQRQKCLDEVYRVLSNQGKAIILSVPDFENIAKAYLNKQKIIDKKIFDLYEVYRFTHGEPEQAPTWWLGQLHKSLFDTKTLSELCKNAGFSHFVIFRSNFADEFTSVNLGIIAYKKKPSTGKVDKKYIADIFKDFNLKFNPKTIVITHRMGL